MDLVSFTKLAFLCFKTKQFSSIFSTGASAANSQSQGFNCGYSGCSGSLGFSGSQSYNLPGGRNVAFSLGRGVSFVPGQAPSISNSNSFTYTR